MIIKKEERVVKLVENYELPSPKSTTLKIIPDFNIIPKESIDQANRKAQKVLDCLLLQLQWISCPLVASTGFLYIHNNS